MKTYILKIIDLSDETIDTLTNFISDYKKESIKKFLFKDDKIRCLLGDLLIRSILICKYGIKNEDITLSKNDYGKPFIYNLPNLYFNLSHSGEYIVCCLSNFPIGVDIELIKIIDIDSISKHFFTSEEYNYIFKAKTVSNKLDNFYTLWTAKESFVKCVGKGLSIPLNSFSIILDNLNDIRVDSNHFHGNFSLKSITIDTNYKLSICSLDDNSENIMEYVNYFYVTNHFINK